MYLACPLCQDYSEAYYVYDLPQQMLDLHRQNKKLGYYHTLDSGRRHHVDFWVTGNIFCHLEQKEQQKCCQRHVHYVSPCPTSSKRIVQCLWWVPAYTLGCINGELVKFTTLIVNKGILFSVCREMSPHPSWLLTIQTT